jgi:diacylglycerol kinase family enzyme
MEMEARVTVTVIRLSRSRNRGGELVVRLGIGLLDEYLEFLGGRCRPNMVLAVAYDLGLSGDRTFVNDASFGVYAEVVRSPAYRDDRAGTVLQMLPDMLGGHEGAHLVVRVGGKVILDGPQAVLVSNNPYEGGDIAGLGWRARLDQGVLGVIGVKVQNAAQAAGLLSGAVR